MCMRWSAGIGLSVCVRARPHRIVFDTFGATLTNKFDHLCSLLAIHTDYRHTLSKPNRIALCARLHTFKFVGPAILLHHVGPNGTCLLYTGVTY